MPMVAKQLNTEANLCTQHLIAWSLYWKMQNHHKIWWLLFVKRQTKHSSDEKLKMSVSHIDDSMERQVAGFQRNEIRKLSFLLLSILVGTRFAFSYLGQCRCNLGKWGEVSASRGSGSSYWRTAADVSPSKGLFGPSQAKRPQSEHFILKRNFFFRFRLYAVKIIKETWLSWKQRVQTT